MDFNTNSFRFTHDGRFRKNDNYNDTSTTLSLNYLGYGGNKAAQLGPTLNSAQVDFSSTHDDGCGLVLGLGPTPSLYNDRCTAETDKNKSSSLLFSPKFSSESDSLLKLGLSGQDCSLLTETDFNTVHANQDPSVHNAVLIPVVDEGSTSAKNSGGYIPSLLLAPRSESRSAEISLQTHELLEFGANMNNHHQPQLSSELSASTDFSVGTVPELQSISKTPSDNKSCNSKKCRFFGCSKGSRGATGLCIGHGGGQRCHKPGCNKGAESRTAYCKAHGGGKRCQHLGCTKSAEGKTDFCIAHGGGKRCGFPGGCTKAARGKSGLCIKHGGGKRCMVDGCSRSAEGQAGLCISHGGGRRCQYEGCTKGAQGSTILCKAHGGGKRCIFAGCTKGAEGSTPLCKGHGGGKRCLFDGGGICPKSVHGGTNFCVAHGGGKRCVVPGCTRSARGRTDCCVRHGGGKRCKIDYCGKSAQGSTDFCKAHGGGKRCSWGEGKCEKFARGKSGLCAAHSSMVLGRESKNGSLIGPGLFHGLVSATSAGGSSLDNTYSSSGISAVSDCTNSIEKAPKRQNLIPPQVLVPLSMKSTSISSFPVPEKQDEGRFAQNNYDLLIPEGRVHGGGLMSLLNGSLKNVVDGI
ncbi:hypothetical protein ACFE04_022131 [Oxalis oulophora]